MSETVLQTVSCGILKATEMVLTRIWMIFAGRVAEPHSVAAIALTNIVQARVRASRAVLWACPSSQQGSGPPEDWADVSGLARQRDPRHFAPPLSVCRRP